MDETHAAAVWEAEMRFYPRSVTVTTVLPHGCSVRYQFVRFYPTAVPRVRFYPVYVG